MKKLYPLVSTVILLLSSVSGLSQSQVVSIEETVSWLQKYAEQITVVSTTYSGKYSINLDDRWRIGIQKSFSETPSRSKQNPCLVVLTNNNYQYSLRSFEKLKKKEKADKFVISEIKFSFSELNPNKTQVRTITTNVSANEKEQRTTVYFLDFVTTNNNKSMLIEGNYFHDYINPSNKKMFDTSQRISSFIIGFSNQQMATRYGNALRNAINVCGGKTDQEVKEPFD